MKGKLLDFSVAQGEGVISGDDGNRYTFLGKEWKSQAAPQVGMRVDFETDGRSALGVYLDVPVPADDSEFSGLYRSSDENMIGGVCAGLAHKWKVPVAALRIATVIAALVWGLGGIAYIVCWIVFPQRPTKPL